MHNYFCDFLSKRGLTEDTLTEIFSYEKKPILGTETMCHVLHSAPKSATIGILSDYDTDGLMSAMVLYLELILMGFSNISICPRDINKGYEFDCSDIDALGNIQYLITSDVGISCCDAIAYAKSKGIFVIVTDHHVPTVSGNTANVIVDWVYDSDFYSKNTEVCGAFTAYQFGACYFDIYGSEYPNIVEIRSDMEKIRHLAAIATVADQMPLVSINHHIVAEMLHFFNYINPLTGTDAIVKGTCYNGILQNVYNNLHRFITMARNSSYNGFDMNFLNFTVIPIFNSIKRMHDNTNWFYSMLFGTPAIATQCAEYIIKLNSLRKCIVEKAFDDIYINKRDQLFSRLVYIAPQSVILTNEDDAGRTEHVQYHVTSGIFGLLATKLLIQTGLPAIVLGNEYIYDENTEKWCLIGSVRSPKWFHFLSIINNSGLAICKGHNCACAIKVPFENLNNLIKFIDDQVQHLSPSIIENNNKSIADNYDVILDFDENYIDFIDDLEIFMLKMKKIAPFGPGFPAPNILLRFNKEYGAFKALKNGIHTKDILVPTSVAATNEPDVILTQTGFDVVSWNTTIDQILSSSIGNEVYLQGNLQESFFDGKRSINFVATPVFTTTSAA